MSQLRRALETTDRAVAIVTARLAKTADSRDQEMLRRLVAARAVIVKAAIRTGDAGALSILTPAERRSSDQTNQPSVGVDMSRAASKLVKRAAKIKKSNPGLSTGAVLSKMAEQEPVGSVAREALSVAGAADTIAKMRRKAGLR
jgi:hypothetical protein